MKERKLHPLLGSSANPEELAMTVKGLLIGLVPLFTFILSTQGVQIDESILLSLVERFTTALSAVLVFFGVARKVYYKIVKK